MLRTHRRSAGILAVGITLLVTAALADLALWAFARVPNPYANPALLRPQINQYIRFEYPPNYSVATLTEDGLPGMSGTNRFSTNNMGFRGGPLLSPKPNGEFRIFLVGGSTVECFYLDDTDEIGAVLERELATTAPAGTRVAAYNAGLSGAASDDHVAMMDQRLVHLEPDLIVVCSGINDLTRSIHDYDYLHFVDFVAARGKPWYKRLALKSQIARRVYILTHRPKMGERELQEQRPLKSDYLAKIGLQRTIPDSDTPPRTDVPSYATNLKTMIGVAKAHGIQLVFATQGSTWNSAVDPNARAWHWLRLRDGVTYREDLLDEALEALNDAMREQALEHGVPLYELARALPKSLDYYYDDCHLNRRGASAAAEGLAAYLVDAGLVPAHRPPDAPR